MKNIFLIFSIVCFLCGCSAVAGNRKLGTSEQEIQRQMADVATKKEVREKFGTPNLIFHKDELEYYEYKNVTGHGRYLWLVPVIGWFASLVQDNYTYCENNLFIGFDKTGKIEDWNVLQSTGTFD